MFIICWNFTDDILNESGDEEEQDAIVNQVHTSLTATEVFYRRVRAVLACTLLIYIAKRRKM